MLLSHNALGTQERRRRGTTQRAVPIADVAKWEIRGRQLQCGSVQCKANAMLWVEQWRHAEWHREECVCGTVP